MRSHFRLRMGFIAACVLAFAVLLVVRLYFVQVVHGEEYKLAADRQYVRPNYHLYDRGTIYLTDHKTGLLVAGARLQTGFTVAMTPKDIADAEAAYQALAGLLALDRETFMARAAKKDDPYEELAKRVSTTTASRIEALALPGIQLYREQWRSYPGGTLAAQIIGFVGYKGDDYSGRYGLERFYDDVLSRSDESLYVNFFAELFANLNVFAGGSEQAGDIVTSLEPSVELYLEETLENIERQWGSRETGGIIIDPKTGSIYAMASMPTFDPNNYGDVADVSVFVNPLVERVYEMGSIVKPITMAIGLDSGAVRPESTYRDEGRVTLDGATISNFDGKGRGLVDMQEVLNQSLNTGAVFVMRSVGRDAFRDYLKRFRVGDETGVDLPNEGTGLVSNLSSPRDIEYATASFGQGIALSPINMVRALSVLASGGVLTTPHVGQRIVYESGLSKRIDYPGDGERVLKPETAEEITRMLVKVVDTALVNGGISNEHYSIAAKTGTAQIALESGKGYHDDRYLHSFFGYFPAYDARFLIFLYTVEPKGVKYASQTLTQPFSDLVSYLINYYEIPPDR